MLRYIELAEAEVAIEVAKMPRARVVRGCKKQIGPIGETGFLARKAPSDWLNGLALLTQTLTKYCLWKMVGVHLYRG